MMPYLIGAAAAERPPASLFVAPWPCVAAKLHSWERWANHKNQGFSSLGTKTLDGAEKVEKRPSPLNPTFAQADCREGQGEDLADRHLQGAGIYLSLGGV